MPQRKHSVNYANALNNTEPKGISVTALKHKVVYANHARSNCYHICPRYASRKN